MDILWFKFFFGLKILKPVSFLFFFISDYGNESETKENKIDNGLKISIPKKTLPKIPEDVSMILLLNVLV